MRVTGATMLVLLMAAAETTPSRGPAAVASVPAGQGPVAARLQGNGIRIEFDQNLRSRIVATLDGGETVLGPFAVSESVSVSGTEIGDFALAGQEEERVQDALGAGRRLLLAHGPREPRLLKACQKWHLDWLEGYALGGGSQGSTSRKIPIRAFMNSAGEATHCGVAVPPTTCSSVPVTSSVRPRSRTTNRKVGNASIIQRAGSHKDHSIWPNPRLSTV
jgi:hypothetical protein